MVRGEVRGREEKERKKEKKKGIGEKRRRMEYIKCGCVQARVKKGERKRRVNWHGVSVCPQGTCEVVFPHQDVSGGP